MASNHGDETPVIEQTQNAPTVQLEATNKVKLNPPTPFDGKRNNFLIFMQDIYVYLKVNRHIYNDDDKKISFILSYLTGGDASIWKQQFIQSKIEEMERERRQEPDWGSYDDFIAALKTMFAAYDEPGEALEEMKKLRLNEGSITEHISQFKLLAYQAGMRDSSALMDLFHKTLPWALQRPIITSKHPPRTIEEWYTKATNFYVGFKKAQRLFKRKEPETSQKTFKRFTFSEKKDPNAMDIDRMTVDEHARLMKEGRCFRCKNTGHLSRDCPNKNNYQASGQQKTEPKKWTGMSAAAHIRALISSMSDEEKKILEDEGEKNGMGF
jgi:Ty3 transposon capsid-like protein/Zinc knuckle